MNAYGINFVNRTKRDEMTEPPQNRAEFMAFAALCESFGVAEYVKSVMYDGNISSFCIEVDEKHEHNNVGRWVGRVADATLSQFILFGYCHHKHSLESDT